MAALRSCVVNLHGRSLAAVVPVALALVSPAAAGAACAQRPIDQIAREVPIVVTAKAQPGPVARNGVGLLAPATFKVVAYDKGSGPTDLKVQTALSAGPGGLTANSVGVNPSAGQTWRLWGTIGADGVMQTNVCLGSTLAGIRHTPSLAVGARSATLRVSSLDGVARGGQLPTVTVPRGGRALLKLAATEANFPVSPALARSIVAVRVRRGTTTTTYPARWSASDGVLSARVSAPRSGTSTIVVITRAASFAARLRAG